MRRNHPTKLAKPGYDIHVSIHYLTEKTHPVSFVVLEVGIYGMAELEHLSITQSVNLLEVKTDDQHTMFQRSLFVALYLSRLFYGM